MHGSAATDLALLCRAAGVEFWMAHPGSKYVATKTKEAERSYFGCLGAKFTASDDAVASMLSSGDVVVALSTPGQIEQYKTGGWKPPFVVRHGLNSFDKFAKMGTRGFITASNVAMSKMPDCKCFLTRKLIPWDKFPKPNLFPDGRNGFSSFIHDYSTKWPREYSRFQELNAMLLDPVVNYGAGSPRGMVNDLAVMGSSRATVHIKGGNAVCNAVVRSMAVGTPVVMDDSTYGACHFDAVDGILVRPTLSDVAKELGRMMDDEYLEEQCIATYASAKKQFVADEELAGRFRTFLYDILVGR